MGNNMCSSQRRPVADRFTRPQRLLRQPSDVDYKKLKKLIRSRKLAPCFDAVDDPQLTNAGGLEECPICFLYYPSLNRSRCCGKGICTECFLQMKPSHTARTAQCPFCKAFCYAVEFHGARTEEEKSLEQAEEQKYIEAKIRMQSEPQIEEKFMPGNRTQSAEVLHTLPDVEESSREQTEERDMVQHESSEVQERTDIYGVPSPYMCWSRHHEFDTDLEEIMMMEATWKSLQDSRSQMNEFIEIRSHSRSENLLEAASSPGGCGEKSLNLSLSESIAVSIARLTEHSTVQQTACEPEWEPNRTNQSPQRNFVRESNSTRLESGHSSGSYLSITEQPCI